MTDRDRVELQMSPGMQPPSGLADRVLVGLAVAVLIGAAVIAVGNVLPDPDEIGQASAEPSSRPSRTPRPSATPILARVATLVEPDIEITPAPPYAGFDGWIRALRDLPIRASPGLEAEETGVMTKDSIAIASSQDQSLDGLGWLFVQERGGWVASTIGGVEVVRRFEYPRYRYSGWVNSLTAGPDGFVAILSPPGGPDVYEPARPATSTDGATWRSADPSAFDPWGLNAVAWGPAGWLAAGYVSDDITARIWIWGSPDGLAWTRLGMLDGVEGDYVTQLVASDRGYLLETYSPDRGLPYGTLWSSLDGLVWRESTDPLLRQFLSGGRRIAVLPDGFYTWDAGNNSPGGSSLAAFSGDGLSWSEVENGPDGSNLEVTSLQGGLVAIGMDRETLAPRVWSGVVQDGQVSWIRETASEPTFAGAIVRHLVSDGARVFAVGWDRATDEPLVWTGDGLHWARESLPESFGGVPLTAAAGPGGAVVVGSRHTLRGDNPIFWRRSAGGGWLPEWDPILEAVPDPQPEDCPSPPDEFLEYTVVDAAAMVACYGAAPITFRAYSSACEGCAGGMEGNPEPAWLLDAGANQLWLSPNDTNADYNTTAVLSPQLIPLDPAWTQTWVEVTGHYDDPAAATCHREPLPDEIPYWYGQQPVIDQCRMTFVVSEVTVVSGP
jgi:hypothetical protein